MKAPFSLCEVLQMGPLSCEASNTKVSVAAQSKVAATQDSTNLRCIFCGKQHYVYIIFSSCGTYYLHISITFVSVGHSLACGIRGKQQATFYVVLSVVAHVGDSVSF